MVDVISFLTAICRSSFHEAVSRMVKEKVENEKQQPEADNRFLDRRDSILFESITLIKYT